MTNERRSGLSVSSKPKGKKIGNSVLLLGDCLEVMKSIPDRSIDMILTDPP